ncbi:MAG TPA: DNA-directed RNA polymerase subunit omega [Sedimentisphaerales bacterium]|nr:DNA-directed RNA polymerase subunit omega [Sedimentisphaerales bacterium]
MIEELKDTKLADKVGGRYKLAVILQKRMLELMQGSRPLIENIEGRTMLQVAVEEVRQDKITLEYTAASAGKPSKGI